MNADTSFEAWVRNEHGKKNHLDHKRLCEGYLYQSFSEDLEYILANLESLRPFLWTVFFAESLDRSDDPWRITPGYQEHKDRAGYLIAGKAWKDPNAVYYY